MCYIHVHVYVLYARITSDILSVSPTYVHVNSACKCTNNLLHTYTPIQSTQRLDFTRICLLAAWPLTCLTISSTSSDLVVGDSSGMVSCAAASVCTCTPCTVSPVHVLLISCHQYMYSLYRVTSTCTPCTVSPVHVPLMPCHQFMHF